MRSLDGTAAYSSSKEADDQLWGLSESEVLKRRAAGLANAAPLPVSRTYREIFLENVFTFINVCLFGLGVTLATLGRLLDALISTAIISLNILVSVVQEARAKRTLDQIALLTRPMATVVREGCVRETPPDSLVFGDVIKLGPGDQIVVDGRVIGHRDTRFTVDESLLTGEAEPVLKTQGDTVYSGSFCVAGAGYYRAERVGADSLAHQITSDAPAFRRMLTPLQQEIHLVVRIALIIVVYVEFLLVVQSALQRTALAESVENATIVAALVPNGLFLSIAIAYALGAIHILRFGALVQQSNAIESLSHIDVLCLDKTGTLTANRLHVAEIYPLSVSRDEVEYALSALAASASGGNKTSEAIQAAFPGRKRRLAAEIPLSSVRKWSAVLFANDDLDEEAKEQRLDGVYALGAPELLRPYLRMTGLNAGRSEPRAAQRQTTEQQVAALTVRGLRVLLLAHQPQARVLEDRSEDALLPSNMEPLGLIALRDELRPEATAALRAFAQAGVKIKLISGDNAQSVAALARQAGLEPTAEVVSGLDLDGLGDDEFSATADAATIFGRITPQQKARIVRCLRERGRYVGMIGDGVNDVLSLKQANLGIAMRSGSQATRGVADIVLMDDSFAVLAPAAAEGQRILNGMQAILKLFLTRISTVGLVIISSLVVGVFPLELRQGSLVTLFSVGVPTILLAIWAHPGSTPQGTLTRRLLNFIAPPALITSAFGLILFAVVYGQRQVDSLAVARTTLTAFLVFCGLFLVIFAEPPTRWWTSGNALAGDWRPTWLAVSMMVAFVVILMAPPLRALFALQPLAWNDCAALAIALGAWLLALRVTWKYSLLSRFLDV
jgi:cation-transporting P-type ATPase E